MSKISKSTSIEEMAAYVCEGLSKEDLGCFLSGGAVVSIYTDNEYESLDLDFVSFDDRKKIEKVMIKLGFEKNKGRHYTHSESDIFVEFPGAAALIGDQPIEEFNEIKNKYGKLKLLTPTDSVRDRLAAFYHWNDKQGLDQAVMICLKQKVSLFKVKSWSEKDNMIEKYEEFLRLLKVSRKGK